MLILSLCPKGHLLLHQNRHQLKHRLNLLPRQRQTYAQRLTLIGIIIGRPYWMFLEQLLTTNHSCGEDPIFGKKYAAHFSYGYSLENQGDLDAAIIQYQAALAIDPKRKEALDALIRLNALPELPLNIAP